MNIKQIFIIIPAYNAQDTIASVFERIPQAIWKKGAVVIVINDGSKDNTREEIIKIQERYGKDRVHLLDKQKNEGYAQAQKSGFSQALEMGADIVVLLHSDGQYAPEEMPRLLEPLENDEADMVLASRMKNKRDALRGGMPLYKWIANIALSSLENIVYGLRFSEYHSGYMLYSRKALETIPFKDLSDTFHFDGEMLLVGAKNGLRVADLPIPTHYGDEESHLKPIEYGIHVLKIMWKYKKGGYNHFIKRRN